ncbi:hypothetical protein SLEP1_g37155 [Rubroshorea leprosula]|uniref:Uncharacterized protein n=1 Tax=Rubroshorea leprosula TaxID=152421 RepID=A0AAV5KTS8_9ROSI|nr:hypothetical protein SLEP1_g37155 [Rubroshorea leprosula]
MGKAPCCDKANVKKGPWSPEEDNTLRSYLETYGTGGNWITLPRKAGLKRCGKSCRLRWLNYLRPDIKLGGFTQEEDNIICDLYKTIGSRWSTIASKLPGRTDNDVKNHWNTRLKKKILLGAAGKNDVKFSGSSVLPCPGPNRNVGKNYLNNSSTTTISSYSMHDEQNPTDYQFGHLLGHMGVLDFSSTIASSSQNVSSFSSSSSSSSVLDHQKWYSDIEDDHGILLDFGFEASHDDVMN